MACLFFLNTKGNGLSLFFTYGRMLTHAGHESTEEILKEESRDMESAGGSIFAINPLAFRHEFLYFSEGFVRIKIFRIGPVPFFQNLCGW